MKNVAIVGAFAAARAAFPRSLRYRSMRSRPGHATCASHKNDCWCASCSLLPCVPHHSASPTPAPYPLLVGPQPPTCLSHVTVWCARWSPLPCATPQRLPRVSAPPPLLVGPQPPTCLSHVTVCGARAGLPCRVPHHSASPTPAPLPRPRGPPAANVFLTRCLGPYRLPLLSIRSF